MTQRRQCGQKEAKPPLLRLLYEISGPQLRYATLRSQNAAPSPLATSGRSSATVTKKPVSFHDVAKLIELLNDRWQRVPCPTIRPNEINFLPRRRHTRVPKIGKLIKFQGWKGTVHVDASVRFRGNSRVVVRGSH
jgi:hypothetical protein